LPITHHPLSRLFAFSPFRFFIMIELAPDHKFGLSIATPVLPAAGTFGYGEAYRDLVDYRDLGALVTNPVSLRPRGAANPPRLAVRGETLLVHTGHPNPGLSAILRQYRELWERLGLPVILHVLASSPAEMAAVADKLAGEPTLHGIELGLDEHTSVEKALALLRALRLNSDLPVIVRLPFSEVAALAGPLAEAGVDALTLTAPPRGLLPLLEDADEGPLAFMRGRLYGPALLPLLLHELSHWAPRLSVPVIACGGIGSLEDARACLALGAVAVQLDASIWRQPELLHHIARELPHDSGNVPR
ncbi:MAG TPA: hypothetical protein P5211_07005, partial [Anaerolineae bacterium]|nr:hypothetical protein [Anaerolineae bacterium]